MKTVAMLWAFIALIGGSSGASAQTMYRCGSVYQDRPCEAGAPAKVMRSSGGEAASNSAPRPMAADPDCIKRGTDAQQIVWSRESGKTAEDLSRQAQNEYQRGLIAEVYAQRGTAPQVRDSVQARCQQDREQMGYVPYTFRPQGTNVNASVGRPLANSDAAADTNLPKAASSYNNCDYFKAQRDAIRSQERQGGSIQYMESVSQRRKSVEKSASAQGC